MAEESSKEWVVKFAADTSQLKSDLKSVKEATDAVSKSMSEASKNAGKIGGALAHGMNDAYERTKALVFLFDTLYGSAKDIRDALLSGVTGSARELKNIAKSMKMPDVGAQMAKSARASAKEVADASAKMADTTDIDEKVKATKEEAQEIQNDVKEANEAIAETAKQVATSGDEMIEKAEEVVEAVKEVAQETKAIEMPSDTAGIDELKSKYAELGDQLKDITNGRDANRFAEEIEKELSKVRNDASKLRASLEEGMQGAVRGAEKFGKDVDAAVNRFQTRNSDKYGKLDVLDEKVNSLTSQYNQINSLLTARETIHERILRIQEAELAASRSASEQMQETAEKMADTSDIDARVEAINEAVDKQQADIKAEYDAIQHHTETAANGSKILVQNTEEVVEAVKEVAEEVKSFSIPAEMMNDVEALKGRLQELKTRVQDITKGKDPDDVFKKLLDDQDKAQAKADAIDKKIQDTMERERRAAEKQGRDVNAYMTKFANSSKIAHMQVDKEMQTEKVYELQATYDRLDNTLVHIEAIETRIGEIERANEEAEHQRIMENIAAEEKRRAAVMKVAEAWQKDIDAVKSVGDAEKTVADRTADIASRQTTATQKAIEEIKASRAKAFADAKATEEMLKGWKNVSTPKRIGKDVDVINAKINELKGLMDSLPSNQVPSEAWNLLEKRIAKVNKQIEIYEARAERAKKVAALSASLRGKDQDAAMEKLYGSSKWGNIQANLSLLKQNQEDLIEQQKQMAISGEKYQSVDQVGQFNRISDAVQRYTGELENLQGAEDGVQASGFLGHLAQLGAALGSLAAKVATAVVNLASKGFEWLGKKAINILKKIAKAFKSVIVSAVKKAGSAIKSFFKLFTGNRGKSVTDSIKKITNAFTNLWSMLKTRFKRRLVAAIFNDVKGVFTQIATLNPEFNQSVSDLVNSLRRLGAQILTIVEPIITRLTPYVTMFVDMLADAADSVAQFFAQAFGYDKYTKATKGNYDFANSMNETSDSAKNASKSVKEYENTVLGFDQLNKLNGEDDSSSDEDTGAILERADAVDELGESIWDLMNEHDYEGAGKKMGEAINKGFAWLKSKFGWEENMDKFTEKLKNFSSIVNGFVQGLDGEAIGEAIGDILNTLINSLDFVLNNAEGINFTAVGDKIGTILIKAVDTINWNTLGKVLVGAFRALGDVLKGALTASIDDGNGGKKTLATALGEALKDMLSGALEMFDPEHASDIIALLVNSFNDFILALTSDPTLFADLGAKIGDTLSKALDKIDKDKMNSALHDFFYSLAVMIGSFAAHMDWGNLLTTILGGLGAGAGGLIEGIMDGLSGMVGGNSGSSSGGNNSISANGMHFDVGKLWVDAADVVLNVLGSIAENIWNGPVKELGLAMEATLFGSGELNGLIDFFAGQGTGQQAQWGAIKDYMAEKMQIELPGWDEFINGAKFIGRITSTDENGEHHGYFDFGEEAQQIIEALRQNLGVDVKQDNWVPDYAESAYAQYQNTLADGMAAEKLTMDNISAKVNNIEAGVNAPKEEPEEKKSDEPETIVTTPVNVNYNGQNLFSFFLQQIKSYAKTYNAVVE